MKRKGFGVEDAPFMLLAAVVVMLIITWIGISIMASFVEGNEHQSAVEASTEIYKRAKLLSLGYDGSSDRLQVSIPRGYEIKVDGNVVALKGIEINGTLENLTELTDPLSILGVGITSEPSKLEAGDYTLTMVYNSKDAKIDISAE
jgi:hypothetical protein